MNDLQEIDDKRQTIAMTFRVRPRIKEMMDEVIEKRGGGSYTEVFRNAIFDYYKRTKPVTSELSPAQEEKMKKIERQRAVDNMTDEQFVNSVWQAPIFDSETGEKYFITHYLGNTFKITPVSEARELNERDEFYLSYHLNASKERNVLDIFRTDLNRQRELMDSLGLVIPDEVLHVYLKQSLTTPEKPDRPDGSEISN